MALLEAPQKCDSKLAQVTSELQPQCTYYIKSTTGQHSLKASENNIGVKLAGYAGAVSLSPQTNKRDEEWLQKKNCIRATFIVNRGWKDGNKEEA